MRRGTFGAAEALTGIDGTRSSLTVDPMLSLLSASNFKAMPWLERSQLLTTLGGSVRFSDKKPNVIVGPNGAGKSALLDALALRFLASQSGVSALDDKYLTGVDAKDLWSRSADWRQDWRYLEGLEVRTDNGPALYYRPNHIPGNESDVTHALMCGYEREARAFDALTREKSSGQKSQALLERLVQALRGEALPADYVEKNWRFGRAARSREDIARPGWVGPWEYQAEVLKELVKDGAQGRPLVLMDEPEQSLDARAEVQLWKAIEAADCSRMQVIVATHSVYPLLHPGKFRIIEAVEGYARDVRALMR